LKYQYFTPLHDNLMTNCQMSNYRYRS